MNNIVMSCFRLMINLVILWLSQKNSMVLLCSDQIALHSAVNHVLYLLIILAKAMFRPISQSRISLFLYSKLVEYLIMPFAMKLNYMIHSRAIY